MFSDSACIDRSGHGLLDQDPMTVVCTLLQNDQLSYDTHSTGTPTLYIFFDRQEIT